jgi:chromosome segregation ATPase
MDTAARFDDMKYNYSKFDRTTWAAPHDSRTVIKYIAPRVIAPKTSNSFQGSSRGVAWSRVGLSLPPATPTDSGLATFVQSSTYSTISSLHSIDGERIIDEQRELSQITETLAQTILQWCCLGTHNRAVELQIEWLEQRINENRSIIEQMFRTEIESAKKQVKETLQNKPALETKVLEALKAIPGNDEKYQKLLSKRNALNKELFDFERKIAQNNAESQFLQRRTRQLDDESKFYLLKNQAFDSQRVRLRYELDEEKFAQETLKAELEILQAEKITNEDTRLTSVHDARNSVDIFQVVGIQFSKYYSNQLNEEVHRIRDDYQKKIAVYREELHRKCELELYRYEMQKSRPVPSVTREHELQLEQYHQSQKDLIQQINAVRGSISEIILRIETVERNLMSRKHDENSEFNRREQLIMLNQSIHERERQLDEAIRIRKGLKEKIEIYKERLSRYPRNSTQNYYNKRVTIHDSYEPHMSTSSSNQNSKFRSSLNDVSYGTRDRERSPLPTRLPPSIIRSSSPERAKRWSVNQTESFQVFILSFQRMSSIFFSF